MNQIHMMVQQMHHAQQAAAAAAQQMHAATPPRRQQRLGAPQLTSGSGGFGGVPSYPPMMQPQGSYLPPAPFAQLMPPQAPAYMSMQMYGAGTSSRVLIEDEEDEAPEDPFSCSAGAGGSGGQLVRRGGGGRGAAIPSGFQSAAATAPQPPQMLYRPDARALQHMGQVVYQAAAAASVMPPPPQYK
jgi:hypothetical protein